MTSDTFVSRLIGDVYAGPSNVNVVRSQSYQVGEAGIKPGYAVRVDSSKKVYLAKASDKKVSGIAALMPGHEIDTAYTITTDHIEIYQVGSNMVVWAFLLGASPLAPCLDGDKCHVSATDGFVEVYAYADGADTSDSHLLQMGHFREDCTSHATDEKLVRIQL
jgi:hypothetical protein